MQEISAAGANLTAVLLEGIAMRKKPRNVLRTGVLFAALALAAIGRAGAQNVPKYNVEKITLRNGLTVLALEDHFTPSVAYYTVFKVGSRNERPGITGLSHLFEHMMFNGSAKFKPKVFDQLIEAGGGDSNAFTNSDTTEYYESFSSPTLDTVLQLESDRMRALKLDAANIEQERGIVKEERRVNTDNSLPGSMNELLENNAFVAHPYRWDTIGFMKDIDAITLADAKAYFRIHYAPNNAVVCVVGDFKTSELFAKIRTYYSDIPAAVAAAPVILDEPEQKGEKRIVYYRPAELPAVTFGYHSVSYKDKDEPALQLLSVILSSGESSRLYKTLVYDKQIATQVSAGDDSRADPGLFTFYAQAAPGHTTAECEVAIYATLADIAKNGVTERELQKAKNAQRSALIHGLTTNQGLAGQLAEYEANWGDWRKFYDVLPRYDAVTIADVKRVTQKYFSDRNRTVITLIPEKQTADTKE